MTKAEQFEALALRCELAWRPDRELDAATWLLCVPDATRKHTSYFHKASGRECVIDETRDATRRLIIVPSYTASLDAALTLVPEGMRPSVGQNVHPGYWHAFVQSIVDSTPHQLGGAVSDTSGALALCAAAIRFRAQMERGR